MRDKKINLLFDITLLLNESAANGYRAGQYFVAYNLLKEFLKDENRDFYGNTLKIRHDFGGLCRMDETVAFCKYNNFKKIVIFIYQISIYCYYM